MSNNSIRSSSALDDFSIGSAATGSSRFRKASLDPRPAGIEGSKSGSIAEESEQYYVEPADRADEIEGDREFEFDREFVGVDEFSTPDPFKDKNRDKNDERDRRRKNRRLGKIKRAGAIEDEDFEEEVFSFLAFLDRLWRELYDIVEDIVDEFDNWNKWFKKEKKKPPEPDKSKVLYIRDEFNAKRSPHLWKSDPDRKWILSFGNSRVNNVVSSVLYKYQNETISKDA